MQKMTPLTNEERKNQILLGITKELETYSKKLAQDAKLCDNEARRAIERATETGELFFRINEEKMGIQEFLCALLKIKAFILPSLGMRSVFIEFEKKIPMLIRNIENTLDFLHSIPGARITEAPENYHEIKNDYYRE